MSDYTAPLDDIRFVLNEVLNTDSIRALAGHEDFDADTQDAILEEAGRFATQEMAPLNASGDQQGATWHEDGVTSADGFADAYSQFVAGGWNSLTAAPEHGGMGMPSLLGAACSELWNAANMSFALCPLLTASAVTLLSAVGSEAQKATYLDRMISGEWTGTMDLTEPQAGTDLGAIRTRAEPDGEAYRLFGQKIFITWGEHDMAENIIHLVLARLPDAPDGVKGISLFLVPRYLVNADGSLGEHNDMHCASLEHKLGIHASPTCAMSYGDQDGAVGYLVGEPHCGLRYMFIMMNQARQKMGTQALGLADAACQKALAYARERVQGKPAVTDAPQGAGIVYHPDVRRMLLGMRAQTDAMRGLAYESALYMDLARSGSEEQTRDSAQARVNVLIPITKAWLTELANEITSTGIQVHGGMGFIEETGAAQFFRDVRISAIYEGTNGIQAADLVGRKLLRDDGAAMNALVDDIRSTIDELTAESALSPFAERLAKALQQLQASTAQLLKTGGEDPAAAMANSFNYLMQAGYVLGGWYASRIAQAAQRGRGDAGEVFYNARYKRAQFYMEQILPRAGGYASAVQAGAEVILSADVTDAL